MDVLYINQNKTGQYYFDSSLNAYVIVMTGEIETDQEYQHIFESLLIEYPNHQDAHLVFNNIDLKKSPPTARAWFIKSIVPRFAKLLRDPKKVKVVMVQPAGLFQKMTTAILLKTLSTFSLSFSIKKFDTFEEGKGWLKE